MIPIDEQPYPLPNGWQWCRLGDVCKFIGGGTPSKNNSAYLGGNIPWASVKDIKGDYLFDTIDRITESGLNNSSANLCEKDDLILVTRIEPGKSIVAKIVSTVNQDLKIVKSSLPAKFLYYFFNVVQQEIEIQSSGSTVKGISLIKLKNFPIPLPPLDEQQRIVALLDELFADLDEAKVLAQSVVEGSKLRRAAILHKAFTGEISRLWRDEHGTTLDSWQRCRLGDVCQINPPKISTRDLSDDLEISFVPMATVSEVRGEITAQQKKFLREVKSGFTNFAEGDVLFAKITPCMENGKAAFVGELVNHIGYGSTEFFVLRCGEKILNHFVYHLVRWQIFRNEAKSVMAGAVGQQRVPKRFLTSYQLNLPPPEEQKEIVRLLDDLLGREQRTKKIALKTVERVELMKKSILARAFRGELGINKNLRAI